MKYLSDYVTDPKAVKEVYNKCSQVVGTPNNILNIKLLIAGQQHWLQLLENNQNIARCKWYSQLYILQNREGWIISDTAGNVQYTATNTSIYPWKCQWPQNVEVSIVQKENIEALSMGQQLQQIQAGVQKGTDELRQIVANRKGQLVNTGNLNSCVQQLADASYIDIHSFQLQVRSLLGTSTTQIQNYQQLLKVLQKFGKDWKGLFSDNDWYKCISVNYANGTWTGIRMQIINGSLQPGWQYNFNITSQRKFGYITPAQGQIWNGTCTIQIINRTGNTDIIQPQDMAFYLQLDRAYIIGEQLYPAPQFGASWYISEVPGIEINKEVGNRKCLYLKDDVSSVSIDTGGSLCAQDATTANIYTGCSARYGDNHTDGFTYSFLFYPGIQSTRSAASLFCLGYYYNSSYQRRFVLEYNATTGAFLMKSTQNQALIINQAGYAEKGKWHHICITNNGKQPPEGEYKLFIDGKYIASFRHPSQWIPTWNYTNGGISLGGYYRYNNDAYPHAVGGYANMRWYNRPLQVEQILALAQEARGSN